MLEFLDLHAGYGKTPVLRGVTLRCDPGTITTVIGVNGCGKSTLLKSALGMADITSGSIALNGTPLTTLSTSETAKHIAYLAQGKSVPDITVERLVLHGRFPYLTYPRRYSKSDKQIAAEAMQQLGITHLAHTPLRELSGGLRQKAYIAMALCQQADVICMDEPTTYLDIGQQRKLVNTIKDLAHNGKTILLVLHDIQLALHISDRIAVLQDGVIRTVGTPQEIIDSDIIHTVYGVNVRKIDSLDGTIYHYE